MVSIIMGVYNCENTLEESIRSIIYQTYTDWELIICDDASIDNTYNIAKQFESQDSRIRVLRNKENRGLAATLNECLKYVNGDYVARMDGDDISESNRLEIQIKFLEENREYDLVGSLMQSFDEKEEKHIIGIKEIPAKTDLPKFNPFHHATVLMKRDVMVKLQGYRVTKNTRRAEDVDLWFRFYKNGYKGYNLQLPLYRVREDKNAYKRRKLIYSIQASQVLYQGIKLLELPPYYYIYIFKPVISWLLPVSIKQYWRKKMGNFK